MKVRHIEMNPKPTSTQIDEAILAVVLEQWRKVAMIIAKASDKLGIDGDDGYNLIAKRIEALVLNGCLEAQGDVRKWRYSEIRKPRN